MFVSKWITTEDFKDTVFHNMTHKAKEPFCTPESVKENYHVHFRKKKKIRG